MASIILAYIDLLLQLDGGFSSDNPLTTMLLSNGSLIRLLDLLIVEQYALCGLIFRVHMLGRGRGARIACTASASSRGENGRCGLERRRKMAGGTAFSFADMTWT